MALIPFSFMAGSSGSSSFPIVHTYNGTTLATSGTETTPAGSPTKCLIELWDGAASGGCKTGMSGQTGGGGGGASYASVTVTGSPVTGQFNYSAAQKSASVSGSSNGNIGNQSSISAGTGSFSGVTISGGTAAQPGTSTPSGGTGGTVKTVAGGSISVTQAGGNGNSNGIGGTAGGPGGGTADTAPGGGGSGGNTGPNGSGPSGIGQPGRIKVTWSA